MPPAAAIAVPAALGVASMISGNVQQKNANANNLNQQGDAVKNTQAAYANAQAQMQQLLKSNPSPFAGQSITAPTGNYGGAFKPAQGGQPNPVAAAIAKPLQPAAAAPGAPAVASPAASQPVNSTGQKGSVHPITLNPILRRILAGNM